MSEIQVENITARDSNSAPNFAGGITFGGLSADSAIPGLLTPSLTVSNIEPDSATATRGNFWFNDSGSGSLSIYNDGAWWTLGGTVSSGGSTSSAWYGDRAVYADGQQSGGAMEYFSLTSYGSASSFGNLPSGTKRHKALSDATYGLFCGLNSDTDGIEYITISTPGNGSAFGNLTQFREDAPGVCNGTRGCFGGGYETNYASSYSPTVIDYVTPATPGNATDFGDMSFSRFQAAGGGSDTSRGLFAGGWNHAASTQSDVIDYITFDTPSNATDFGDMTVARRMFDGCSDGTYAVYCGGSAASFTDVMDYVTIQTTGNATDFGNVYNGAIQYNGVVSNGTDGFIYGGSDNTYNNNQSISTFNIATPANATLYGAYVASFHCYGTSGNSS